MKEEEKEECDNERKEECQRPHARLVTRAGLSEPEKPGPKRIQPGLTTNRDFSRDISTLDVSTLDISTLDISTLDISTLDISTLDVSTLDVSTLSFKSCKKAYQRTIGIEMDLAATSSATALTEYPALEKTRGRSTRISDQSIDGSGIEWNRAEKGIGTASSGKWETQYKAQLRGKVAQQNGGGQVEVGTAVSRIECKQMQNMHAETVESFKKSLSEIQQTVEEKQEHSKRVADVEKLSKHLNQLTSDYETRLTELKKLYEQREADLGVLAKAKDSELDALHTQIGETQKRVQQVFAENVLLKKELLVSEDRVKKSIETEIGMRKLLDEYSEKYSELTKSLSQSNSSFDKVKDQMGKMNSKLIRMESEARKWKNKAEEAARVVTALRGEKAETEQNLSLKDRQLAQLQELCRALKKAGDEPKRWEGQSECEAEGTDVAGGDAALSTSRHDQMAA
uniref:Uncharacterized protein n=1 Tax=Globodera rostochiensis TaxID=31243 RepID=A0A914GR13_GLORO